ncbi:MAG: ssDNA-dependent ATPase helicase superfamily II XpB [Candidatus Methanohalarchaeum thermophilum]|uniref:SsDNA-dependent ATPase helicase superfamily II XpB n=1 Tax=Methanohalarchaeum thermophilum TaxID=1903181 RepID=A0A1Q6DSS3_METT1|nr:MAG: ssDNA-dependent ATPase helicase superfamily II XpB [Candidatus Methanohalarchaeum thermophilum]
MELRFQKGTIIVDGSYNLPHTRWDDRSGEDRALALHYRDILDYLKNSDIPYEDNVMDLVSCLELKCDIELRPYQEEALDRWRADKRGVLILPTGSGKTYIGMAAIQEVNAPAFVVVPTLDLVDQWRQELKKFDTKIGEYTGREKQIEAITVSTYDSAYNQAENIGNRFKFVVFDEVHHLASEGYRHIAELFASPYRMGLTATYERQDDKHKDLTRLLGGKVYEIETEELTGEYLSKYTVERITVDLTPSEKEEYDEKVEVFRNYLMSSNLQMRGPSDYRKIVMRSGNDPRAWKAVRARNDARQIAYSSNAKLNELANLLKTHRGDRIIIFTRYNDLVYEVADRYLIPPITHKTPKEERRQILQRFKEDKYSAIVSSQVLDEGVDVPDANIGIILSGTGSSREYRQRLGRILRPSSKKAKLYEIVSKGTGEIQTSYRRKT